MKILVVDDEKPAREKIVSFLNEEDATFTLYEADNGFEAIRLIELEKPDLVFLDIQMPGKTGFEVISEVGIDNMPSIIFVTAYDQFAINVFEIQAVDYLLKPYDRKRFKNSFERVSKRKENGIGLEKNVLKNLLTDIQKEKGYLKKIMVKKRDSLIFIKSEDVIYINSEEKYIKLHTLKSTYLVRETMNNIEQKLNPEIFVRTHRSYIVNSDFIKEIQPWTHGDYIIILESGSKVKLSRRYSNSLLKK